MAPRIIVLHGWGQDKKLWGGFVDRFQREEVAVLDLPGFGEEPLVSPEWGIPEYGAWVKGKIEELKEDNVVLLGHSFGGRIASYLASENPHWLKALVLYGTPSLYRPSISVRSKIRAAKILKKAGFSFLKKLGIYSNKELEDADRRGMGNIFRRAISFDQTGLLPKIAIPTLVAWGENDAEVSPAIAREISRLIPGSKLVMMQKLGHNAHLENPDLFYGIVNNFIKNL